MRVALFAVAILAGVAHADSSQLAKAREAIDGVNYTEARTQLDAALAGGGLTAAETAEAHRLLGNTLAVIGKPDEAEQAYQRYLALDPRAELATTAPAKQRRPFEAARAFVAERGALEVAATRTQTAIEVAINSDPLSMAAFATLHPKDPVSRVALGAGTVSLPAAPTALTRVTILDARGNTLVEIEVPVLGTPVGPGVSVVVQRSEPASPPIYRRWPVWAVPAVAFGAVGAYFVVQARDGQADVKAIAGTHGEFFASELADAESRRDRSRLLAGVLLGGAVACAATAVVMLVTAPNEDRVIAPTAIHGGAGVVFHAQF